MTRHRTPARRTLLLNHFTCKTQANVQLPPSRPGLWPRSLEWECHLRAELAASFQVQRITHPVANCPCSATHRAHQEGPPDQAWVAVPPNCGVGSCLSFSVQALPQSDRHPLLCPQVVKAGTILVQPQATRALPLSLPTWVGTEGGLALEGLSAQEPFTSPEARCPPHKQSQYWVSPTIFLQVPWPWCPWCQALCRHIPTLAHCGYQG